MNILVFRFRIIAILASAVLMSVSGAALADPPSRVARLGYIDGPVSFSPAGENDWFDAPVNRPLASGDRLWSDEGARAEVQVGGAMIRLDANTGASVLNMDDRIAQLQLTQGRLNVRVVRLDPGQLFEVDTPNLAFTLRQPGEYRIEVDPDGDSTTIVVRKGSGEAYGQGAAYVINSRQAYRFTGTGLSDYGYVDMPRFDDFDRWSSDRDRRYENSESARYVSQDVVGYQDLDSNGSWRVDVNFGNVWVPRHVSTGWAPYRDGHWAWIDPWGWTWVDNAPWGYTVSHYGRWMNFGGTWAWVPGPARARSYYAPALVVFLGGSNFQLRSSGGNVGGVAWFPLGPRDVYRPSYPVSRRYFEDVNRSNTVINTTVINNYYSNTNVTRIVYVNRQVPGAVIAVPRTAFEQSQPVAMAAVSVSAQTLASEPVEDAPAIAPTERSVRGAAPKRDRPPPTRVFERPVVARTAPPPAHAGFAAQETQLKANPGKPLDDTARKQLKRGAAAPTPAVNVIAQAPEAPPTALPPPPSQAQDQRGKSGQQGKSGQHNQPADQTPASPPDAAAPVAKAQPTQRPVEQQAARPPKHAAEQQAEPPVQATAATPAVPPADQHGKSGQQGKSGQHSQPADQTQGSPPDTTAPVAKAQPTQRLVEQQAARPPKKNPAEQQAEPPVQATAATPAVPPADQHGKSGQQGNSAQHAQHAQPAVPTPASPPAATAPGEAAPVQAARPAAGAPQESAAFESGTTEPASDAVKKKPKKKAADEPAPEEDNTQSE